MEELDNSNIPNNPVTEVDLSLIPIPDLLEAIRSRTSTFIYGYDLPDEKAFYQCKHHGLFQDRVFISKMLDHMIVESGFENPE